MRNQLNHTASMATTSVEASTAGGGVAASVRKGGAGAEGYARMRPFSSTQYEIDRYLSAGATRSAEKESGGGYL